jgi:O-antigen/teichoic acid export membrane protein
MPHASGIVRDWSSRAVDHVRHPLNRTGYALILSSTFASGVGFLYWVLAARLYPADIVGKNSAAIAAMSMLAGIAILFLDGTLVRFIPRAGQETRRLVYVAYSVTAVAAVLVSVAFLVLTHYYFHSLQFLSETALGALAFVLFTVSWCIFVEEDAVLAGLRRAEWIPPENGAFALLKVLLLVAFASNLETWGILASWSIPAILLVPVVNYFIFRRFIDRHVDRTAGRHTPLEVKPIVRYAGGNYVGFLLYTAYLTLPPLIVLHQLGSAFSAYFYPPWVIAGILALLSMNMGVALTVEGADDPAKTQVHFRYAVRNVARLLVPVIVVLLVGADFILELFGSGYATHGATLLRLLALASIPQMLVVLKIGTYRVERRLTPIIITHSAVLAISLGLTVSLLPHTGISGVGVAVLTAQSAAAAGLVLFERRRRRRPRRERLPPSELRPDPVPAIGEGKGRS